MAKKERKAKENYGINKKQREFLEAKIEGLSNGDAYARAYLTSKKWASSVRNNAAARLMRNTEVQKAYKAMLEAANIASAENAAWSREKSVRKRLQILDSIEIETRRRAEALVTEAHAFVASAKDMTPDEINLGVAKIMQKRVVEATMVSAIASLMAGLDRLYGFEAATSDVNVTFVDTSLDE